MIGFYGALNAISDVQWSSSRPKKQNSERLGSFFAIASWYYERSTWRLQRSWNYFILVVYSMLNKDKWCPQALRAPSGTHFT